MNKQKVLDILNSLEIIESQGGEDAYALVENSEENHKLLNDVGVSSETIDKYGDEETFCIFALAFSEGLANFHYKEKIVYLSQKFDILTDNNRGVVLFEHDGQHILGISVDGGITYEIEVLSNERVKELSNLIN